MKLNEQIQYERKKMALSREKFVKELSRKTQLDVSPKKVQRWEEGTALDAVELQCLSEFFEVKVSDLLDESKDPFDVSKDDLREFGKCIFDYSQMDNIRDVLEIFYITKKGVSELVPRYDIELQGANNLLESENDLYNAIKFADLLFSWCERCREISSGKYGIKKIEIRDDTVGSRSFYDPRTVLDIEEITLIKEGIISKLYWFNYEVKEYLYDRYPNEKVILSSFVKREIYT